MCVCGGRQEALNYLLMTINLYCLKKDQQRGEMPTLILLDIISSVPTERISVGKGGKRGRSHSRCRQKDTFQFLLLHK